MRNRAVFIDRDGTIAPDVHYCYRVEDFELFPDVALMNNNLLHLNRHNMYF